MNLDQYPLIADWITQKDGRLIVHSGKVDIGQRISSALAQIAHEELGIPHEQIEVAPVRTDHAPDEGITSGSNSIEQSGHAVRCASATLRERLVEIAVSRLGGTARDWVLEDGDAILPGTNHRIPVTGLMDDIAADEPVDPSAKPAVRQDGATPHVSMRGISDLVRGAYVFVHDLDVPNMLHARVVRPPHPKARLISVDEAGEQRLKEKGLTIVRDGSFLAITGDIEWAVVQGAQRFAQYCEWEEGGGLPEVDIFSLLKAENATRLYAPDADPVVDAAIPEELSAPDNNARFERPYQLHGSLAPSAAMAEWRSEEKKLALHSHSQGIYPLRGSIAESLGLDDEQVDITHVPGSGCYGHSGADDAAFEAALVALAIPDRPVLLKWTREDEHMWEPFAPAMAVDLAASIRNGRVTELSAEVFSDTHRGRPRPGPNRAGPGRLLANRFREDAIPPRPATPNMGRHIGMHRNLDPIYAFPYKRLVKNLVPDMLFRTSAMRCLGGAVNVFAIESFLDDLATDDGIDPFEFRLAQLSDKRDRAVVQSLRQKVQELPDPGEGSGRGIAYAQYKNSMTRVAICVDLDVTDSAEVRLRRATMVADAGRVIDAEGLTAQLEGGFVQAASWALYEQVKWDRDGVQSKDWDSYPVIRFDNIPPIDVTLIDRAGEKSVGAGEASPGPSIAAIRNAIRDAVGIRLYRMPFTPEQIRETAAEM